MVIPGLAVFFDVNGVDDVLPEIKFKLRILSCCRIVPASLLVSNSPIFLVKFDI